MSLKGRTMGPSRFSVSVLIAFVAVSMLTDACSGSDTTGGAGGGSGNATGGAGGGSGTAAGGASGSGGTGGGGMAAGGTSGSGGASAECTGLTPLTACPARGTHEADNCRAGATCCDGTQKRTCFCAAETCTFYFGI